MCRKRPLNIKMIESALASCEAITDTIGEYYVELESVCGNIVKEIFAARGVPITEEQIEMVIRKISGDDPWPYYRFVGEIPRLAMCSRAVLQNWLDLGEDAVIKFHHQA